MLSTTFPALALTKPGNVWCFLLKKSWLRRLPPSSLHFPLRPTKRPNELGLATPLVGVFAQPAVGWPPGRPRLVSSSSATKILFGVLFKEGGRLFLSFSLATKVYFFPLLVFSWKIDGSKKVIASPLHLQTKKQKLLLL